jgi:leader peptidase (prepilin peptidase) / N-methyltransferase
VIEAILALVFGLLLGSFLNVCIHRWPRGRSVIRPRSHCVRCRKTIAWYDNIPVLSWLLLRGKCRHCGRAISPRYPLVESLTGLVFFFFVFTLGPGLLAVKMCAFAGMLLALVFCDLEKRLLPDEFTLGGTLAGFAFALFVPTPDRTGQALLWIFGVNLSEGRTLWLAESVMGAVVPSFFLWAGGWLYEKLRHREGLGLGDVKLIAMVGSFLGLQGALLSLVAGSMAGSLLGYGYIRATGKDAATFPLPFGSFLGGAALAAALAGQKFLGWYTGI